VLWSATGNQLRGPFILPRRLTFYMHIYAKCLRHELSALFKMAPLRAWRHIQYQHDRENLLSVQSSISICLNNSSTDGSVAAMCRIGQRRHRTSSHSFTMCWLTWGLWCMQAKWTRDKNYTEFSALQDTWSALQDYTFPGQRGQKMYPSRGNFEQLAWIANYAHCALNLSR
jgi:hypothetical protein